MRVAWFACTGTAATSQDKLIPNIAAVSQELYMPEIEKAY